MPNLRGGAENGLDTWAGVSMQVSDRLLARQNKARSERKEGQVKGRRGDPLHTAKFPTRNLECETLNSDLASLLEHYKCILIKLGNENLFYLIIS